jgi:hypothetical protein
MQKHQQPSSVQLKKKEIINKPRHWSTTQKQFMQLWCWIRLLSRNQRNNICQSIQK